MTRLALQPGPGPAGSVGQWRALRGSLPGRICISRERRVPEDHRDAAAKRSAFPQLAAAQPRSEWAAIHLLKLGTKKAPTICAEQHQ